MSQQDFAATAVESAEALGTLDESELYATLGAAAVSTRDGEIVVPKGFDEKRLHRVMGGFVADGPVEYVDAASVGRAGRMVYSDFLEKYGDKLKVNFCGWYSGHRKDDDTGILKTLSKSIVQVLGLTEGAVVVLGGITFSLTAGAIAAVALAVACIAWLLIKSGLDVFCEAKLAPAT